MPAQPKDQYAAATADGGVIQQALGREVNDRIEALDLRIVVEQAKAAISTRHSTTPDIAFAMLCGLARSQHRDVYEYAKEVVAKDGRLDA